MSKEKPSLEDIENATSEALANEVRFELDRNVQVLSYVCIMEVMDEDGDIYLVHTRSATSPSYKVLGMLEWVTTRIKAVVAFGIEEDDDE